MPASPVADIRNPFGAAFIGLVVSTTLFGLTIVQTWIYYWNYRNRDSKALKFFIAFISVADGLHTILCFYAIYWYLVLNFGNVENLDYSMWAMHLQIVVGIFVSASVQFCYAKRVYTIRQSVVCPIAIVVLVVVSSSLGFVFTAKAIVLKRFSSLHTLTGIICIAMATGALADLLIAAVMCWSLYHRRTGTDSMITSLMVYSINSGLLTSLLAVAMTITFVLLPSSLIWVGLYWLMSKCYVNSFLAMLNSRDHVRNRSTIDNLGNSFNLSSKSGQAGVAATVHRPTTLNSARNKSDHDVEPTFEGSQPGVCVAFQSRASNF